MAVQYPLCSWLLYRDFLQWHNPRMVEAGRDLWKYLVQTLLRAGLCRASCSGYHLVRFLICPGMETSQPLWPPVPVFNHCNRKKQKNKQPTKKPTNQQPKNPLCSLPLILSLGTSEKILAPSLFLPSRYLYTVMRLPLILLFCRLSSPTCLSLSSYVRCLNFSILFVALCWTLSNLSMSLSWRPQSWS